MYTLRSIPVAEADIEAIYKWIDARSPEGAKSWFSALCKCFQNLRENPDRFGPAEEAATIDSRLRQALFHTRRGRFYRIVFLIEGENVVVLRVRGPGQTLLSNDDLQFS